jgi:RNA polymerase sigma-70 factor (ECF subfamily)
MEIDAAIEAVRNGDREAYAEVVAQSQRRLRAFLAFHAPNRELVDEVAQQAYITAFEKLGDYQLGTSFLGWIKHIALNHLRNEVRRRQRAHSPVERLAEVLAPEPPPENDLADETVKLERCLSRLDGDARRLLEMRYREGLSPLQLAEKLGRLASSVRVTLTRLRQVLLECMQRHA